jgi:hypothetical protein
MIALLGFLLISLPFIALISNKAGELTFGQAGTITYVRYVNGVSYPHWQGEPAGNGTPIHPSRQIFEQPPIYEFGSPIGGTYPISFNPVYWYEGVTARFDLAQQLRLLLASLLFYFELFFHQQGVLLVGVITLYLLRQRGRFALADFVPGWGLVIPALAAFGLYALVLVEGRYIGVFAVLVWADPLANVRLPDTQIFRKLILGVGSIIIIFILMNILAFNLQGFRDLTRNSSPSATSAARPPDWPGEVAEALQARGIQPGDKVGVIGYAFDSFWARLARVQIVAEMLDRDADAFWVGEPVLQAQALKAFADAGAKAVVAEYVPGYASLDGWQQIGNSNFYIYVIQ